MIVECTLFSPPDTFLYWACPRDVLYQFCYFINNRAYISIHSHKLPHIVVSLRSMLIITCMVFTCVQWKRHVISVNIHQLLDGSCICQRTDLNKQHHEDQGAIKISLAQSPEKVSISRRLQKKISDCEHPAENHYISQPLLCLEEGISQRSNQETKGNSEGAVEIHSWDGRSCSQNNHSSDTP